MASASSCAATSAQQLLPADNKDAPPLRPLPVADVVKLGADVLGAVYLARGEARLLAGLQRCLLACGHAPCHDLLGGALVVLERAGNAEAAAAGAGAGGLVLRRVAAVLPEGSTGDLVVEGEGAVSMERLSTLGPPDPERPTEGLGPHAEALVQEACWQWCHHALPIHSSRRQVALTYLRLNQAIIVATAKVGDDLAQQLGYESTHALSADVGSCTLAGVAA